jgi:hypothetical protein
MPTRAGITNTTAYRVIREVVDHVFDPDTEIEDDDVIGICDIFRDLNGSWEMLMGGDMDEYQKLENAIESRLSLNQMARQLASRSWKR